MFSHDNDFLLTFKVQNGRIISAIRDAGSPSIAQFCKINRLNYSAVIGLISMRLRPLNLSKEWSKTAQALSDALRALPEDLFPDDIKALRLKKNTTERYISLDMVKALQSPADPEIEARKAIAGDVLDGLLDGLDERQAKVLRWRFGLNGEPEKTLKECGDILGIQQERVRQIEQKALRTLKHPNHTRKIDMDAFRETA